MGDAFIRNRRLRKKNHYVLEIDSTLIDSTLTNFPILVTADSQNYDMSLLTNDNVYFTDSSDNLLDFEIEYNTETERVYHVKIPTIDASTNTIFKLYFNGEGYSNGRNSSSVWDSNYFGVYHLGNTTNDSSQYSRNGSNFGTTVTTTSPYGVARNFDGNDYIYLWPYTTLELDARSGNPFSATVFFRYPSDAPTRSDGNTSHALLGQAGGIANAGTFAIFNDPHSASAYGEVYRHTNYRARGESGIGSISNQTVNDDLWHVVSLNWSGSQLRSFFDGDFQSTETVGGSPAQNDPLHIGSIGDLGDPGAGTHDYFGQIKEVRISNNSRSDAWITAEHESLRNTLISSVVLG
jgi:hypothetical protein